MPEHETIFIDSYDFYDGYKLASLDFETKYSRVHQFDDMGLTGIFVRLSSPLTEYSDAWKSGYFAGFYASLYGIPCRWSQGAQYEHVLHFGLNELRRVS